MNPHTLRQYLLGKLPPAEREALESRAFNDDDFQSLLEEAETDLLDDWARRKLPPEEARVVQARFSPEKRLIARRLAMPPRRENTPRLWWVAAAAALIVVASATYIGTRPPIPPQVQTPQPATIEVASIDLRTPGTRGVESASYRLSPSAARLRFTAPLIPGFSEFHMRIESAQRGLVAEAPLTLAEGRLAGEQDATRLPDGDYDILISGRNQGPLELLATYPIRIERRR